MQRGEPESSEVLAEFRSHGRQADLAILMERHRGWVWGYVRKRMGGELRLHETSEDVVQDVLLRLFQAGPALPASDEDAFRRLVATIVINRLRDRHDWVHAARRARGREPRSGALDPSRVAPSDPSERGPARVAQRNEERERLELALEAIEPEDARLIHERDWAGRSFRELGALLDLQEDAARMRYQRAVRKLGSMMALLNEGRERELAPELDAHS